MPRNAKNPNNPYADAIDEMDARGLHIILDYITLKGGASGLRFLSIGKLPGLLEVIHYIHHELSVDHKCESVFDYFQLDGADCAFRTPPPTTPMIHVRMIACRLTPWHQDHSNSISTCIFLQIRTCH